MRQIVLDTETTGLEPEQDHRIIEIGCVEMVDRRLTGNNFHVYLQPDRVIDAGAVEVHGITNEFLEDKPRFPDIVEDFLAYITGAELVIHNAPFDVGFMDHELTRMRADMPVITESCSVLDTLVLARRKHPGKRNNLDASQYESEIWNRASRTLTVLVMPVLALAFVFGSLRSGGAGGRLVIGVVIGLAYYLASETLANSGQVFNLNPVVVNWLPFIVLCGITSIALARIR